jgi:predicted metal-dependent hydrolase
MTVLSLPHATHKNRYKMMATVHLSMHHEYAFHPWPIKSNFLKKIYLFNVCECTVALFTHTRRGHQIPLQMVVSHHVVAGTTGRAIDALNH